MTMRKNKIEWSIQAILCLWLSALGALTVHADEHTLSWNLGDKRTYHIEQEEYVGKPGSVRLEQVTSHSITIAVVEETSDALVLTIENSQNRLEKYLDEIHVFLQENNCDVSALGYPMPEFHLDKRSGVISIGNWNELEQSIKLTTQELEGAERRIIQEKATAVSEKDGEVAGDISASASKVSFAMFKGRLMALNTAEKVVGTFLSPLFFIGYHANDEMMSGQPASTEICHEFGTEICFTAIAQVSPVAGDTLSLSMSFEPEQVKQSMSSGLAQMFGSTGGSEKLDELLAMFSFEMRVAGQLVVQPDSRWITSASTTLYHGMKSPQGYVRYKETVTHVQCLECEL